MKKVLTTLLAFGALALFVLPTYAEIPGHLPNNGNSLNKATGTVTWTARSGALPGLVTEFDAHDLYFDSLADKGTIHTYRPSDDSGFEEGTVTIDLFCVNIATDEAWFAGTVVSASGGYSNTIGDAYLYWVKDVATPGSEGDLIGGMPYYSDLNGACEDVESHDWTGTGAVTDGNLVVHQKVIPTETAGPVPTATPLIPGLYIPE
jgi:hypothetical protein